MAIGAILRFSQLTAKPPWTDEFATLVFSLGNSYKAVPLDQVISVDTLLKPLQLNPTADASAVMRHLFAEDHHPPLYFVLAHWWMYLLPKSGEYVSLWAARSLPALFGVASIPAVYGLGLLAFRSRLVAQLAAAMMAVSPYGIFIAQEARHYTLGILWIIASLCCLVVAVGHLKRRTLLPIWLALCWVVVNALGMATHYFFSLTLCAEAIVLIGFWMKHRLQGNQKFQSEGKQSKDAPLPTFRANRWRMCAVAVGTLVGCLVWVPILQMGAKGEMTQWIKMGAPSILTVISPIFQALATWIAMLALLPVESPELPVIIASGLVMLVFFIWAIPILYRSLKVLRQKPDTRLATGILGGFVLGAIAIFFGITYILGIDLTRGARYNFVYFPAVIVVLGAALSISWNTSQTVNSFQLTNSNHPKSKILNPKSNSGKLAVALIWFVGLLSGITVINNLGYQKYYRPDLLAPVIQKASSAPILIATTHNTLVQTGEMMGLAWEFKRVAEAQKLPLELTFLLAHQEQEQCVNTSVSEGIQQPACSASTTLKHA
ncbi:MAG TPA: glycosyltransferase, partial [Coleofasciculaceae cyanobacterium]